MDRIRVRRMILMLAAALCLPLCVQAAPMTGGLGTMPRAQEAGPGQNEVVAGISPTTGLPWTGEYRPIAVVLSNQREARPILGLAEADVVYESIYAFPGHTRYMAVFSDNHPEIVGGIRSTRLLHLELREEWDAPLVFWSSQGDTHEDIRQFVWEQDIPRQYLFSGSGFISGSSNKGLSRVEWRRPPHNAVADLSEIATLYWPLNEAEQPHEPKPRSFLFDVQPMEGVDSDSAERMELIYDKRSETPIYHPSYQFDPERRVYERYYCGEKQKDGINGKPVEAANVIVQYCAMTALDYSWPAIEVVGGGVMDAFIDGRHIRGTWERQSLKDRTVFYNENREEIAMLPGTTFIQLVPWDFEYEYAGEDGTVITVTGQEAADTLI